MRYLWWLSLVVSQLGLLVGSGELTLLDAQGSPVGEDVVDTTIQPGHQDFSRYTTPSVCLEAVRLAEAVATRTQIDTGKYAPDQDTLSETAMDVARRCGSRFTAGTVAPRELLSLVGLSIARHDETQAQVAANRCFGLLTDQRKRGWAMLDVERAFLGATPMHRTDATAMAARLDSLGPRAAVAKVDAHYLLLMDAEQRFDPDEVERQARLAMSFDKQLTADDTYEIEEGSEGNVVYALLAMEVYRSPTTAVSRLMQVARDATYHWPSDTTNVMLMLSQLVAPLGRPMPSLPSDYWFGPHGSQNWNLPGKVSLFMAIPRGNTAYLPQYAMIQRLHRLYGDALQIVFMTRTLGYINSSGPLAPAQEADSLRQYYQGFLHLPITLGIETTPFHRLLDGRRIDDPPPLDRVSIYSSGTVLADPSGEIVALGVSSEKELDAYIDRMLRRSADSSTR